MLGVNEEEFNKKLENLLEEYKKLPKEVKESVLAVAEFIMKVDGKIDTKEEELFNKMSLLI